MTDNGIVVKGVLVNTRNKCNMAHSIYCKCGLPFNNEDINSSKIENLLYSRYISFLKLLNKNKKTRFLSKNKIILWFIMDFDRSPVSQLNNIVIYPNGDVFNLTNKQVICNIAHFFNI
jgi:hypothetical protein